MGGQRSTLCHKGRSRNVRRRIVVGTKYSGCRGSAVMSSSIDASAARLLGSSASFSHSRESHSHLSLSSGRVSFSAFRRQYSDCSRQAFASFIPNSPPSSKRQTPAKPRGRKPGSRRSTQHVVRRSMMPSADLTWRHSGEKAGSHLRPKNGEMVESAEPCSG